MVWVIVVRSCDDCESLTGGDEPGVLLLLLLLSVDVAVDSVVRLDGLFPSDEVVLGVDVLLSPGFGELVLVVDGEEVVSTGGEDVVEREGEGEGDPPPPVPGALDAAPEFPSSSFCLR